MKKIFVLSLVLGILILGGMVQTSTAQKAETLSSSSNLEPIRGLIQNLNQSVSYLAAEIGFNYQKRTVVGILVSDFYNPAGEEIEMGNQIALELRAALNKGKQFHVYGKEHPVSQSLKASLTGDIKWSTSAQRKFQQNLVRKFSHFPVDLVITGQVSREPDNRIKVAVNLIPFYKPITLVESEKKRTDIRTEQFVSSPLSSQEMDKGLSVIQLPAVAKGRLVIVALMKIEKEKSAGRGTLPSRGGTPSKSVWDSSEAISKALSLNDITCWLDDKELTLIKEWEIFKKKEYHDILGGFGADAIWFDDMISEGTHSLFFSLAQSPSKNRFKTFTNSFFVKGETSNYLFFSVHLDPLGEPKVRIRHILDRENRSTPF